MSSMGFLPKMDLPRDTRPSSIQFTWKTSKLWLIYTCLISALGLPKCKIQEKREHNDGRKQIRTKSFSIFYLRTQSYLREKWVTYSVNLVLPPQTRNVTHLHKHPFQVGNYNSCQDRLPREKGKAVLLRGMVFHVMIYKSPVISLVAEKVCNQCAEKQSYTFCRGSSSFPKATMAIITTPAEMMPAI